MKLSIKPKRKEKPVFLSLYGEIKWSWIMWFTTWRSPEDESWSPLLGQHRRQPPIAARAVQTLAHGGQDGFRQD